ncbi:hypothetical protein [Desulfoluna spongiiphila]|uniref:Uncharacterized protein n=1 Tax=Desulfoluna spongiiphila TaxID=419481 RepID=A0A1G5FNU7_9BACT|nr:hypothetical protein [Desulfoluna spongiiphila]SCY40919.1 hypothetical protein SAMN05216233_108184 [Desulfoluna spongiiphila]VVS95493.1 hypothetical protein DBB_50700 [Desulfoluna spongiiphila]
MTMNGSSMNEELDSRLNELFDDGPAPGAETPGDPLETLKAVILEMEWEIGDKNLDAYLRELKQLGGRCAGDKALSIYIKLLDTIGRYLKAKKASAHPETVSFLKSLFDSFEAAVDSDMTEEEKNRSAAGHVREFKRFKGLIAQHAASKPSGQGASSGTAEVRLSDAVKTYIRQVVREEIARLVKRK